MLSHPSGHLTFWLCNEKANKNLNVPVKVSIDEAQEASISNKYSIYNRQPEESSDHLNFPGERIQTSKMF